MTNSGNLYEILDVQMNATSDEIKSSFRKLALLYHPDKNNNSLESQINFRIIYNAYDTLIDQSKRNEYNIYLRTNSFIRKKSDTVGSKTYLPKNKTYTSWSLENLCSQFNYILWEIEDILSVLRKSGDNKIYSGHTIREWLLKILVFTDKWVLEPAGFIDYFYKARNMENIKSSSKSSSFNSKLHQPYINIYDYFYQIRKRMDRFINDIKTENVLQPIEGYNLTILDCIFESQKLAYHYLGSIKTINQNGSNSIKEFIHSDACFRNSDIQTLEYLTDN